MANILAIDDEIPILELIKNGLQKDGHTVSTYPSVSQIPLEYLNRYDLIMLDIMMPDTDGFTFCKKIRSLVDCPILFLTAKTLENDCAVFFSCFPPQMGVYTCPQFSYTEGLCQIVISSNPQAKSDIVLQCFSSKK